VVYVAVGSVVNVNANRRGSVSAIWRSARGPPDLLPLADPPRGVRSLHKDIGGVSRGGHGAKEVGAPASGIHALTPQALWTSNWHLGERSTTTVGAVYHRRAETTWVGQST
jgi:hypothetical protein